jgi:hypothetical protein
MNLLAVVKLWERVFRAWIIDELELKIVGGREG